MSVKFKAMISSWSGRLVAVYTLLAIAGVLAPALAFAGVLQQPPWWWVFAITVRPNALVMAMVFSVLVDSDPSFRGWLDGLAALATVLYSALLTGYYLILAQLGIAVPAPASPDCRYLVVAGPLGVLAFFVPPAAVNLALTVMLLKRLCYAGGTFKRSHECVWWAVWGLPATAFLGPLILVAVLVRPAFSTLLMAIVVFSEAVLLLVASLKSPDSW